MRSSTTTSLFTRALALVAFAQVILPAFAHIEMVYPPAINSKYDPQTAEANKDYSMTTPLSADGSNYPCKGYNIAANYANLNSVATLKAGTTLAVQLAGSATHNGGSCQFAISYDQGKTFAVISSIIGGCPIGLNFNVPIPANLPSGKKATLSWTWFNYSGNREMYQNCAIVDIAGSSATSYTGPSLFRANTFADGTCVTTENQDIVFPNPGPSVQYRGSTTSGAPATVIDNCPYNENSMVTIYGNGGSGNGGSSSASATTSKAASSSASAQSTTTRVPVTTTTTRPAATTTTTSTRAVIPSTTQAPPTTTSVAPAGTTSSPKTIPPKSYLRNPRVKPSTTSKSSAQAATTTTTSATRSAGFSTSSDKAASLAVVTSLPAVTTTTSPPSSTPAPPSSAAATTSTSASGEASVRCESATTWSLCGNGVCTFMGAVPAGTVCRNGMMVMARMAKRQELGSHLRMVRRTKGSAH